MNLDLVNFAKALSDDTRQQICLQLCCEWLSVSDLVAALGGKVKQPTVSHHLKCLEEAGLVHIRQAGRQRFYTLNQEQLSLCCGSLISRFAPDFAAQTDFLHSGQRQGALPERSQLKYESSTKKRRFATET